MRRWCCKTVIIRFKLDLTFGNGFKVENFLFVCEWLLCLQTNMCLSTLRGKANSLTFHTGYSHDGSIMTYITVILLHVIIVKLETCLIPKADCNAETAHQTSGIRWYPRHFHRYGCWQQTVLGTTVTWHLIICLSAWLFFQQPNVCFTMQESTSNWLKSVSSS